MVEQVYPDLPPDTLKLRYWLWKCGLVWSSRSIPTCTPIRPSCVTGS